MATDMIDTQAAKKSMRVPPQRWGLTFRPHVQNLYGQQEPQPPDHDPTGQPPSGSSGRWDPAPALPEVLSLE
jgi:hypothetical protein